MSLCCGSSTAGHVPGLAHGARQRGGVRGGNTGSVAKGTNSVRLGDSLLQLVENRFSALRSLRCQVPGGAGAFLSSPRWEGCGRELVAQAALPGPPPCGANHSPRRGSALHDGTAASA